MNLTSFGNIFFRGLTLLSKFIFVIFLGKYTSTEVDLGIYGMLTTSIGLLLYIIGFDFYVFNTREILASKKHTIHHIKNQLYFHLFLYITLLPLIMAIIFYFNFIPITYLSIFFFLFISEHIGQELFRLFTTLEKSLIANFFFFLKSGVWVWIVLIDFFILKNEIQLKRYLIFWLSTSWLSMFLAFLYLKKILKITSLKYKKPNTKWIKKGIKSSSIFFLSSLSFLVIQFSDRYMIDFFCGKKLVGVYTAYAQFTNAIEVFVFSAVVMVLYPKMLSTITDNQQYKKIFNQFFNRLFLASIFLLLISCIVAPYIFSFLNKDSFLNYLSTYNTLLVGIFFLLMSNIYHYDLYAKKKDNLLLKISFLAMLINVVLNIVLIPNYRIFGASIATLVAFLTLFMLKFIYSKRVTYDSTRPNK